MSLFLFIFIFGLMPIINFSQISIPTTWSLHSMADPLLQPLLNLLQLLRELENITIPHILIRLPHLRVPDQAHFLAYFRAYYYGIFYFCARLVRVPEIIGLKL